MTIENNKITTGEFRVCFPHVFKPTASEEGGEEKYSVLGLFDSEADLSELKKLAKAAAIAKWGDKQPKNRKSPFRDGDEKSDKYPEFEGMTFITMSTKHKPKVVDEDVNPIIDESEFYAGCYARASVRAYAYEAKGNVGVAFGLINIQKVGDGEALGGGSNPEDDFEPVAGSGKKSNDTNDDIDFDDF